MSAYLVKSHPWPEIRSRFDSILDHFMPMIELIDWIQDEHLEKEIFAATSMHDLLISNSPSFPTGENMLKVSYDHSEKVFTFTYSRTDGSTDRMIKTVSKEDSIETFRQILAYKFGVHRKPIQA